MRTIPRPQPYILACILVSFGGLIFGLDTGCIGPITTMTQFTNEFGSFSSTVHGLLVSSILIPASLTSFFAGSIADSIGRVLAISIGGCIFALGTALEAAAQDLAMLFVGRCITGVGEGLFLSTLTVYVCEIAPAATRGVLASVQQMLVTFGLFLGYFFCYGTVRAADSSLSWRLPFAFQSFLALSYGLSVFFFLHESPRWLKSRGRLEEAGEVWDRLGVANAEREKEDQARQQEAQPQQGVLDLGKTLEPESLALTPILSNQQHSGNNGNGGSWLRIFDADVRARTALGAFVMGMQQLSGIDGVLYYAPLLFQQAGLSSVTASFLASGLSALLMMLITIPAFLYADKWGRRTSTLAGGLLLAACMLIIGSLYASGSVHGDSGAGRWVVIVLIYIFALTYCASWAVHLRVYASEIQPLKTRAPATSLAQTSNWIVNFGVAVTTPIFLAHSSFGVYFLFGGASLLTVAVCALKMPETQGKTLEEIEEAFHHDKGGSSASVKAMMSKGMKKLQSHRSVPWRAETEEHEL